MGTGWGEAQLKEGLWAALLFFKQSKTFFHLVDILSSDSIHQVLGAERSLAASLATDSDVLEASAHSGYLSRQG